MKTFQRPNKTPYALAVTAVAGVALFVFPTFIQTGFTEANIVVTFQALGISLFVAPVSIYLTLRLSTRTIEEKLDRIAKRIAHPEHPLDAHGISAIFHDRKRAVDEFSTRYKGATEVDGLGVCLPQLASDESFLKYCRTNPASTIRIAVLDGNAEILEECASGSSLPLRKEL